jgi:2-keto-3-deoxy-L-rhamnonate aldolase RhmA
VRDNPVKRTLAQGGVSLGTMIFEFNTTGIGRVAATAGAEFVVFDMEHTGWSTDTIRTLIATSRAANLVPIVRPPGIQYHMLSRPLDVGAMGLFVPMVETEAQAREIVRSGKYFPEGGRGAAFGVAHDDYLGGDVFEKMQQANREVLLIALVETAQGIENVEKIAAVDGIDVLWIGHFDLTNSMGIPAQFGHPDFLRAVDRVLAAATRNNKAVGMMVADVEDGKAKLTQGFRAIAYSGDLWIYQTALRQGLNALREFTVER